MGEDVTIPLRARALSRASLVALCVLPFVSPRLVTLARSSLFHPSLSLLPLLLGKLRVTALASLAVYLCFVPCLILFHPSLSLLPLLLVNQQDSWTRTEPQNQRQESSKRCIPYNFTPLMGMEWEDGAPATARPSLPTPNSADIDRGRDIGSPVLWLIHGQSSGHGFPAAARPERDMYSEGLQGSGTDPLPSGWRRPPALNGKC